MRFNKVLLIYPRYPGSHYSGQRHTAMAIGLGIIGEILKLNNIDYTVVDLVLGYDFNYLNQRIKDYQPDAVGISMMTFHYRHLYTILTRIKELNKNIKIIAGGPHITAWQTKVLKQCPAIDFGVSREGEFTISELCQDKDLSSIKGLIYRQGNSILFNGERELIDNLDAIPFPRYEKFELDKYEKYILICSSRGCPYQCIFCQSCSILGKIWRCRSAGNIADEIQFWHEKGYRSFNFIDDNFTMSKERIYELCDEIDNRGLNNMRLGAPGVRVDLVDRPLLSRMKRAGFWNLAFGIEAGNNKILRILKKGFTIEQAEQTVKDAVELGFDVKLYFLVGSPYETPQDIQDRINFALRHQICDVNFSSLMPIPQTELMDWVEKEGRLLKPPEVYLNEYAEFERLPHFDAPSMTLEERRYALKITEKVARKIRKKWLLESIQKKLGAPGILGKLIANIYIYTGMPYLTRQNKILRSIKEMVLKKLAGLKFRNSNL